MTITIDPHSHLITPLFVRHAWGLARAADIPDLDPLPEVGASALPPRADRDEWSNRWKALWARALG